MNKGYGQHGFAAAWLVVIAPLILVLMGLVLDGGMMLLQSQQLDSATDAAALAATDAWDRDYWKWHGKVRIDPAQAGALARTYLAKEMPRARILEIEVNPENRVTLRTTLTVPLFFLRIAGWKEETVTSSSTAVRRDVSP